MELFCASLHSFCFYTKISLKKVSANLKHKIIVAFDHYFKRKYFLKQFFRIFFVKSKTKPLEILTNFKPFCNRQMRVSLGILCLISVPWKRCLTISQFTRKDSCLRWLVLCSITLDPNPTSFQEVGIVWWQRKAKPRLLLLHHQSIFGCSELWTNWLDWRPWCFVWLAPKILSVHDSMLWWCVSNC